MTARRAPLPRWRRRLARWRTRQAATWLLHRDAVVVDVETTDLDGRICQIAIVDTRQRVLLDTLVDPQTPIAPAARAVHGITDADVAGAPTWEQIAPVVTWLLDARPVAAYNAPFDRGIILAELARVGAPVPASLERDWWCIMRARSRVDGGRWAALGSTHAAVDDCRAALEVVRALSYHPRTAPPPTLAV